LDKKLIKLWTDPTIALIRIPRKTKVFPRAKGTTEVRLGLDTTEVRLGQDTTQVRLGLDTTPQTQDTTLHTNFQLMRLIQGFLKSE
jgi:hypothetical protein